MAGDIIEAGSIPADVSGGYQGDPDLEAFLKEDEVVVYDKLSAYISKEWQIARIAKDEIEDEMLVGLKNRNAQYTESDLSEIQRTEGGSTFFDPITRLKVRAAEALIWDIFSSYDGKVFSLSATTLPDLPESKREALISQMMDQVQPMLEKFPEMSEEEQQANLGFIEDSSAKITDEAYQQDVLEADERAKRMEKKIYDQWQEGGWDPAFGDFIKNLCTFKTGFLKRCFRTSKALKYTSEGKVKVEEKVRMEFEAPHPFDIYPASNARNIKDYAFFEKMRISKSYLERCRDLGGEGFIDANIIKLLAEHPQGVKINDTIDKERSQEEGRPFEDNYASNDEYEIVEYWGMINSEKLKEFEVDGKVAGTSMDLSDPFKEHAITLWASMSGGALRNIIKIAVNPDPMGRVPYYSTSYIKKPHALWGEGIPDLMSEDQRFLNGLMRAVENNFRLASGPQIIVNVDRLPDGELLEAIHPYKIWQVNDGIMPMGTSSQPAIDSFNIPLNIQPMMQVYNDRLSRIDEYTGIPTYATGGADTGGAAGTARGLSMLMNSSSKVLKQVIRNIDRDIIKDVVRDMFEWNMLNDKDELIKGDVNIVASGALSLIVKEQTQIRLNELLAITNNPTDQQIISPVYRGRMLRQVMKDLDLPTDDLLPPEEEIVKIEQGVYQQQAVEQLVGQFPIIQMILDGQIGPNGEGLENLIPNNVPQNNSKGEGTPKNPTKGMMQGNEMDNLDPQFADN